MKLSRCQSNVLDTIVYQSLKLKGKNAGQQKGLAPQGTYYSQTLQALQARGLIEFRMNTIYGNGWRATPLGWKISKELTACGQRS